VRHLFCEYVHGRAFQQGRVVFRDLKRQILCELEPRAVCAGRWDAVHTQWRWGWRRQRHGGKGVRGLAVGRRARMTAQALIIPTYIHTRTQHTHLLSPLFPFFLSPPPTLNIRLPPTLFRSLSPPTPSPPPYHSSLSPSHIAAHFICYTIYTTQTLETYV
jgi:hypothetical protein